MKTDANRQFRSVHNGQLLTSPIWTNITISATGQSNVSGNVFLPKTAESFTCDADGNLTADGRWTYGLGRRKPADEHDESHHRTDHLEIKTGFSLR